MPAVISPLAGVLLGAAVGARHAFEPDHLTAMATLASEARDGRRGAVLGALWGLGHTISLTAVGLVLIAIDGALPARLAAGFELAVSAVLIALGVRAIARAVGDMRRGASRGHAHGGHHHVHAGATAHVHLGAATFALRPLVVGLVHGLAGSGALTALAFARVPSPAARAAFVIVFGLGSIAGMAAVSALAGASLRRWLGGPRRGLTIAAGALSIALGVLWAVPLVSFLRG